jgi:aspartate kinase
MALVVQKYGGTVAGSPKRIKDIAERVIATQEMGNEVVVVISAMEGETDRLLGLSQSMAITPDGREQDALLSTGEQISAAMLALAIKEMGYKARSWLGYQLGIITDNHFGGARITGIKRGLLNKLKNLLKEGEIAVVAGFQGVDQAGNITTLGRGGSDATAVALAKFLKARECEIYTQVDGIYTADPKICTKAKRLNYISYEEMMEMISLGVRALHIEAIDFAMRGNVPLHLRSGFTPWEGTKVLKEKTDSELIVSRVTSDKDQVKITISRVEDKPGLAARIFTPLAKAHILVDMIVQNASDRGHTDMSFTVPRNMYKKAEVLLKEIAPKMKAGGVKYDAEVAKVSIIGRGMRTRAGVAAEMFQVLANEGINIEMISTSEITISVVIREKHAIRAVKALHEAFVEKQGNP